MDFASLTREAVNRTREREREREREGLLRIYLWCPDDFPRLWDRIE